METIGAKILEIRKRKGLTQEELADMAGINLRTLQRIEKNETEPRGNTLKMLCSILDVNVEDIIDYGKQEDNRYLSFFHLSVLSFVFIPLGNLIIPAILWFTKRDRITGLNSQGADLLNFQIMWTLLTSGSLIGGLVFSFDFTNGNPSPFTSYLYSVFYFIAVMSLMNIIYPIVVSFLVRKNSQRRYYFPLIRFIR